MDHRILISILASAGYSMGVDWRLSFETGLEYMVCIPPPRYCHYPSMYVFRATNQREAERACAANLHNIQFIPEPLRYPADVVRVLEVCS